MGKFLSTLSGGSIGTITTWPLVGLIIETIGWTYSFYIASILVAVFTAFWIFIVYDEPAMHPRISLIEKDYIEQSLVGQSKTKPKVIHKNINIYSTKNMETI